MFFNVSFQLPCFLKLSTTLKQVGIHSQNNLPLIIYWTTRKGANVEEQHSLVKQIGIFLHVLLLTA